MQVTVLLTTMLLYLLRYKWLIAGGLLLLIVIGVFVRGNTSTPTNTFTLERGPVRETVSVSGFVEATQTADLGFPATGRVTDIFVTEGQTVAAGDLLATVGSASLAAERQRLQAELTRARAAQEELQNGPTTETRAVSSSTVAQARTALQQTTATAFTKVQNALIALRSTDLEAYAVNPEETTPAPTVSGNYTCEEEGDYTLEVYRSSTRSGYSLRLSGLESGTFSVTTDQPKLIGDCGLSVQFSDDISYNRTEWTIPVPNTRSDQYPGLLNAYNLAQQQAEENIAAARAALSIAQNQDSATIAAPRIEALLQANAEVMAAQANLANVDAKLQDTSITAPFAGTVTDVATQPGEIAYANPVISLIAPDAYTVTARIPEIDITKLELGQSAELRFDAKSDEFVRGTVSFISPVATEIDEVGYFETTITLPEIPAWLRAGLNADIDIVINEQTDVVRIPRQYLSGRQVTSTIATLQGKHVSSTTISTGLHGNNGYVEVTNLPAGTVVVAP